MLLILVFNNCYNTLPQVYQFKITIIYYFTICIGLKSKWAKLGSLLRFSQGWNQGVRELGILSGDSGGESDSRLIQVVGRIQFHKGVELRSPFPSCLLSGIALRFYIPSFMASTIFETSKESCVDSFLCVESLWLPLLLSLRKALRFRN